MPEELFLFWTFLLSPFSSIPGVLPVNGRYARYSSYRTARRSYYTSYYYRSTGGSGGGGYIAGIIIGALAGCFLLMVVLYFICKKCNKSKRSIGPNANNGRPKPMPQRGPQNPQYVAPQGGVGQPGNAPGPPGYGVYYNPNPPMPQPVYQYHPSAPPPAYQGPGQPINTSDVPPGLYASQPQYNQVPPTSAPPTYESSTTDQTRHRRQTPPPTPIGTNPGGTIDNTAPVNS